MKLGFKHKGPVDVLPYDLDLQQRGWLENGDILVQASASIEEGSGTAQITNVITSETAVRVWLAGGIDGETNVVNILVQTQGGITKEFCFHLRIKDC